MKIALCLHGLFNSQYDLSSTGIDGYEYIKRNILDKSDVDVFIHSWEQDKEEYIKSLYQPKISKFEKQIDFSTIAKERNLYQLHYSPRPPEVILSHFYSVSEVMKLPYTVSENYDIIIKSRFDLGRINRNTSGPGHQNPYPVQCINLQTTIDNNSIYTANWNHFHMGPADMWFYGSPKIMNNFTKLYSYLFDNLYIGGEFHHFATNIEGNPGDLSNSIAFYKFWMMKNNLWDKLIKLDTIWE